MGNISKNRKRSRRVHATILGFSYTLHPSFVVFVITSIVVARTYCFLITGSWRSYWVLCIVAGIIFTLGIHGGHELAHLLVARWVGIPAQSGVSSNWFGTGWKMDISLAAPVDLFTVRVAGPLYNLLIAEILFLGSRRYSLQKASLITVLAAMSAAIGIGGLFDGDLLIVTLYDVPNIFLHQSQVSGSFLGVVTLVLVLELWRLTFLMWTPSFLMWRPSLKSHR